MSRRNRPTTGLLGALTQQMAGLEARERNISNAAASGSNAAEPQVVPGLTELVEILKAMAAAPLGARPNLKPDPIEAIKNSPLRPVLIEVQQIYKKLGPLEGSPEHLQAQAQAAQQTTAHPPGPQAEPAPVPGPSLSQQPTPAAAPAAAGITNAQAGLISVSAKLNSVSQAVTDMKDSTKAAKTQIETLDRKVSLISGRLDPALADLTQQVKRLQDDLVDEFNAERTSLETKVKELEAEVEEREDEVKKLGEEIKELKNEAKELQQAIRDTRAELLTAEAASKTALRGTFSDAPGTTDSRRGTGNAPASNLLQTAKQVRTNTLDLITKCRALFSLIDRDPEIEPDVSELGMEGEWARCAEHLRRFNSKLRGAVEEKEETAQKLQFVGWVIDQMRKGDGIPNLGLDFARLAARPPAAPPTGSMSSTAPTGVAASQDYSSGGDGNSSDLNTSTSLP
ncbi:hypothetical protein FRC01_002681 [Tulasnella sp. 417]|nr:hypothetical protein FRC01_002681 [Tulasnella sp. 417]